MAPAAHSFAAGAARGRAAVGYRSDFPIKNCRGDSPYCRRNMAMKALTLA
jgi:hypothetical protein